MRSILFPSRARNAVAALVSLLALSALAAYLGTPPNAIAARVMASYKTAPRTLVEGVVKAPNGRADRRGQVMLVFRNGRGRVIERDRVKVNRNGQFYVVAPKSAKSVVLTAYLGPGRNAPHGSRSMPIVRGKALSITVVFHNSGGGVLPAIFPY
jgi:hypothetical protein